MEGDLFRVVPECGGRGGGDERSEGVYERIFLMETEMMKNACGVKANESDAVSQTTPVLSKHAQLRLRFSRRRSACCALRAST